MHGQSNNSSIFGENTCISVCLRPNMHQNVTGHAFNEKNFHATKPISETLLLNRNKLGNI